MISSSTFVYRLSDIVVSLGPLDRCSENGTRRGLCVTAGCAALGRAMVGQLVRKDTHVSLGELTILSVRHELVGGAVGAGDFPSMEPENVRIGVRTVVK